MDKHFVLEHVYSRFLLSHGVSIDTRTLQKDNLFFALEGKHLSGADFVEEALEKGARFAVVSQSTWAKHPQCVVVPCVQSALQEVAAFHRSEYKRILIGITGSNGKTTTKELLTSVLRTQYITHATIGNQNNHLGVPLTLLGIIPQTEIALVELGTSAPGEIAQLCDLAAPSHGLITHIGLAHTEHLGNIAGILKEKCALVDHLASSQGTFYLNPQAEPLASYIAQHYPPADLTESTMARVLYSTQDSTVALHSVHPAITFTLKSPNQAPVSGQSNLFGEHNASNLRAVIAIARHLGLSDANIAQGIKAYTPHNNRSMRIQLGVHTILLDAYNANPDGMQAALESLAAYQEGAQGVILGDMLELGAHSQEAHKALGKLLGKIKPKYVFLVGKAMHHTHQACALPQAKHFESNDHLLAYLQSQSINTATTWLIKGSRGMAMERTLAAFED